jgi:hypothetical protein
MTRDMQMKGIWAAPASHPSAELDLAMRQGSKRPHGNIPVFQLIILK